MNNSPKLRQLAPLLFAVTLQVFAQTPPTTNAPTTPNSAPVGATPVSAAPATTTEPSTDPTSTEASSATDATTAADTSTPNTSTQPPRPLDLPLPDMELRNMELLAKQVDPESVVWLQALDQKFLALYEPELSGEPKGAILLLHAEGQHADWPNTMEVIRTTLPEHGWTTLATTLPAPDFPAPPTRSPVALVQAATTAATETPTTNDADAAKTTADAPATEADANNRPESEELFDSTTGQLSDGTLNDNTVNATPAPQPPQTPAEVIAIERIKAALAYLNDKGQFNIVLIGDGMGATRAGGFAMTIPPAKPQGRNEKPIKLIRAMIIINARNNVPASDIDLPNALFDPEIPTLDVYFGTDLRDPEEAKRRHKFAKKQGFVVYQQIRIPEMAGNRMLGENRLARRVRGFLDKHAKGTKVDNAVVIKN